MSTLDDLYETDFYAWTRAQTRELRRLRDRRANTELDLRHLIGEVFSLGDSVRDACFSQVERILEHLLKLQFSPASQPRLGWERSIAEARSVLERRLTTTIRHHVERRLSRLYRHARKIAALALRDHREDEAARRLPQTCPYSLDDILRDDWYPEAPEVRNV